MEHNFPFKSYPYDFMYYLIRQRRNDFPEMSKYTAITFSNSKCFLSIQASAYHYSEPRAMYEAPNEYIRFETAVYIDNDMIDSHEYKDQLFYELASKKKRKRLDKYFAGFEDNMVQEFVLAEDVELLFKAMRKAYGTPYAVGG